MKWQIVPPEESERSCPNRRHSLLFLSLPASMQPDDNVDDGNDNDNDYDGDNNDDEGNDEDDALNREVVAGLSHKGLPLLHVLRELLTRYLHDICHHHHHHQWYY